MTKEELKKEISQLSEIEKKERDVYLRDLALGKLQGPPTGYPEIDKPWLKYFDNVYSKPVLNKTVYQEVHDNNLDQPRTIALEFFGSKISFGKLDKNIEAAAKSFEMLGVKKGDFVTIISAGIPETVYSFYALSKLGAISNMMAYYFDDIGLTERINDCNSTILLVMDKFLPAVKKAIDKSTIKKIIVIPTLNSSVLKVLKPYRKDNKELITWNEFIKNGKNRPKSTTVPYEKNLPLTMVYSSGTTGASKGILLSNDSFQESVYAYRESGVEVGRGFKFYQIIPPWYSTGLSTSIHLPLACGSAVFMDPRFERDVFIKNIIKYKPNYSVAPTSMYEGFLDDKLVKKSDLSHFKYPFEGGEPLRREVSDKIEEVFKKHNNNSKLLVGYGQCECGATITSETTKTNHIDGTVGIPLPGLNIAIVDDELNSLTYNKRGQILVDTPCGMMHYFNNETATNEFFYIDDAGTKWFCTGDIGYIDSDGNLFIEGRSNDISYINGNKVYNFDVENVIAKNKFVKLCDVIMNNGKLAVHIVLDESFWASGIELETFERQIQEDIYQTYNDMNYVPILFKIRESFPYAKSGKRNVLEMLKETDGFTEIIPNVTKEKKLLRQ